MSKLMFELLLHSVLHILKLSKRDLTTILVLQAKAQAAIAVEVAEALVKAAE